MGHYCRKCGQYLANENFLGKGHARHICKKCMAEERAHRRHVALPSVIICVMLALLNYGFLCFPICSDCLGFVVFDESNHFIIF